MNSKQFKVGLVGLGVISYNHLSALALIENAKVTALCDIRTERAEARKNEFSLSDAKIYESYEEMLECEELDTIHILTPHYLHAKMAILALEKNINVCLEKPICINREEIEALLEAERKSSAKITVCFQNRFSPAMVMAKKIADEDGVVSAYFANFWERTAEYYTESGWRGSYLTEGGGALINQAIHSIDHLISFLGKPKYVTATKSNHSLKGVIEVEDTAEGMIEFENGKFANFFATNAYHGYSTTNIFLETKNHRVEIRNLRLYIDSKLVEEIEMPKVIGKAVYGDGHLTLITKFYEALRSGGEVPVSLESAQWALRVLLAAYNSNDKKTEI